MMIIVKNDGIRSVIRLSYAFIVSRSTIKMICIGVKRKRETRNEKRNDKTVICIGEKR